MSLHAIIPAIAEDGSLYRIGKLEAHEKGALHLAISVFVFDGEALLIQKRAAEKYHCPGLWANTACSHPHWGEAAPAAAARRLREELGCTLPLECRGETTYRADVGGGLWEHEQVTLFRGEADRRSLALAPDPAEVSETRWATLPDLHAEIAATPEAFAPWFRIYMTRWRDLDLHKPARSAAA